MNKSLVHAFLEDEDDAIGVGNENVSAIPITTYLVLDPLFCSFQLFVLMHSIVFLTQNNTSSYPLIL